MPKQYLTRERRSQLKPDTEHQLSSPERNPNLYQALKTPGKDRIIYIIHSEGDFIRHLMHSGYEPVLSK